MNERNDRRVTVVRDKNTSSITAMVIGIVAVVALIVVLVLAFGGEAADTGDGELEVPTTVPTTITQDD